MPVAMCTWCSRSRIVTLRTWSSVATGHQLVGEVCDHCWFGDVEDDDCRTCQYRRKKGLTPRRRTGVREINAADVARLLEMQGAKRRKSG